jgi:hypothetical protein
LALQSYDIILCSYICNACKPDYRKVRTLVHIGLDRADYPASWLSFSRRLLTYTECQSVRQLAGLFLPSPEGRLRSAGFPDCVPLSLHPGHRV